MSYVAPYSIPTISYSSSPYTSYYHEHVQHPYSDSYGTTTRTRSHSETYSQSTLYHSHSTAHHHYSPYQPQYQTESKPIYGTTCPYPSPPPSAYSPLPETPRYSYSSSSSSSSSSSRSSPSLCTPSLSSSSSSSSSRLERSSYGQSTRTRSSSEKFASSLSDPVANSVKFHLSNRLRHGNLSNSPFGFPFHSTYRQENDYAALSYDSYEFEESVCLPEYPGIGKQRILFRYVSPQQEENGMMAWKVYLPTTAHAGLKEISRQRIGRHDLKTQSQLIAHVQVSPRVMQSSFGADVMGNPSVIMNALALSMERERIVTVEITSKPNHRTSSRPRGHYNPGEVLYVLTDRDGTECVYA